MFSENPVNPSTAIEVGEVRADQVLSAVESLWWQEIKDSQVADDFLDCTRHFRNLTRQILPQYKRAICKQGVR